jgi:hypothetical protein
VRKSRVYAVCTVIAFSLGGFPVFSATAEKAVYSGAEAPAGPRVLSTAEFEALAITALQSANGYSYDRAKQRFAEIVDSARVYPGGSSLARKVRSGHRRYQMAQRVKKKDAASVLSVFTQARVAGLTKAEVDAILSAWPAG